MSDRRARMRAAIADGVDPALLPGLEPMLDRLEAVLDGPDGSSAAWPSLRGLDLLLSVHPHLVLVSADWQADGPWLLVTLGQPSADGGPAFARFPFAIWRTTGAVHGMLDGAVTDDPLWTPS